MADLTKLKRFLDDNQEMNVQVTQDVFYSIADVIRDDERAINAQFENEYWSDGSKKEYFDLSRVMATAIKSPTDIDTKDLGVHAEVKEAIGAVGVMRGVLKNHMKVNDYGTLFNTVRDDLVDYGHVILKKTKEGAESVKLLNVIRPANEMDIQKSGLIEKHSFSYQQMLERKDRWKSAWNDIELLWEKMQITGKNNFTVYEFWCEDNFDGQQTKGYVFSLDNQITEPDDVDEWENWQPQIELERGKTPYTIPVTNIKQKKRLEKAKYLIDGELPVYPYDEERFVKINGRWKGAGVYEITAPMRRAYNKTMNNKLHYDETFGKGLYLHTKGVKGKNLTQAALQALENSGVVEVQQGASLEQLRLQSLTSDFIVSADKFFEFARQLLGLTAQGTGEELPASMSATSSVINAQRSKTTFDAIIETQSLLWKRWFSHFELKDILENLTWQKWVKIEGSDEELREVLLPFARNYINAEVNNKAPKLMMTGQLPVMPGLPPQDLKATEDELLDIMLEKPAQFIEFTKELSKQSQFYLEFFINNESFDKLEKIRTLMSLRSEALVNPNSRMDAGVLEDEIIDLMGLNAKRFRREEEAQLLPPVGQALPPANPAVSPQETPAGIPPIIPQ